MVETSVKSQEAAGVQLSVEVQHKDLAGLVLLL